MRKVVVVPTFDRSEFLYCCLKAIRAADREIPILVFPDRGTDESEVCAQFNAIQHKTIQHSYHGNSYNVMEALKTAYLSLYDNIYIIEDDALIDPSFFQWCEAALDKHRDAFAACGWKYSPDALIGEGPDVVIPWYLSVASLLPRYSVNCILQHATLDYYSNMKSYLDRAFPQSFRKGSAHYEQDGLALRVCEAEGKRCVWPRRPRATHIGFRGYHMSDERFDGKLEDRVAMLELAIANPAVLTGLMNGGTVPEVGRCVDCNKPLLTDLKELRAVCVDCFHSANPGLPKTTSSHYYLPVVV